MFEKLLAAIATVSPRAGLTTVAVAILTAVLLCVLILLVRRYRASRDR